MKVRFLADADLNKAIVTGRLRREPSLDFLTAQEAGLHGMTDYEVLVLAGEHRRVLVSHDAGTMPVHFRAFRSAGGIRDDDVRKARLTRLAVEILYEMEWKCAITVSRGHDYRVLDSSIRIGERQIDLSVAIQVCGRIDSISGLQREPKSHPEQTLTTVASRASPW